MHETAETDIAVVGAGIVGVACALQLARQGRQVTLLDRQAPGHGASFGNAGHLATEQVFPIADLSILKRLPRMLLDPMGPLRLDWKYLPKAMPWFTRLLLNLRPAPFQRSVAGIRRLNEASLGAWQQLLGSIGRSELFHEAGSLLVFERPESRQALAALQARLQQQAVPVDYWSAHAVRAAAPQLSESLLGGLFSPGPGISSTPTGWSARCSRRPRPAACALYKRRWRVATCTAAGSAWPAPRARSTPARCCSVAVRIRHGSPRP